MYIFEYYVIGAVISQWFLFFYCTYQDLIKNDILPDQLDADINLFMSILWFLFIPWVIHYEVSKYYVYRYNKSLSSEM